MISQAQTGPTRNRQDPAGPCRNCTTRQDLTGPVWTLQGQPGVSRTWQDRSEPYRFLEYTEGLFRPFRTLHDPAGPYRTPHDPSGPFAPFGPFKTLQGPSRPFRTLHDSSGPIKTRQDLSGPVATR